MKAKTRGSHTGNTWPAFPPQAFSHLKRGPTAGDKGLALVLRNLSPLRNREWMRRACAVLLRSCGAVSARAISCSSLLQAKRTESQHACVSPGIVCQVYLAGSRSAYRSPCLAWLGYASEANRSHDYHFPSMAAFRVWDGEQSIPLSFLPLVKST